MKSRLSLSVAFASLVLFLFSFAACDSDLVQPTAELSIQARNALDVLPADAKMVMSVDIDGARDNAKFEEMLDEMANGGAKNEGYQRMLSFIEATGFDPTKDVSKVYATSNDDFGGHESQVSLVAHGTLDVARIEAYLDSETPEVKEIASYADTRIFTNATGKQEAAIAFVNSEMIFASSSVSEIHAMLDRAAGGGAGLSDSSEMAALIDKVRYTDGAWVVVNSPTQLPFNDVLDEASNVGVESAVVSVDLGSSEMKVDVLMEPADGVDSSDLASVVKGAIAAAKAKAGEAELAQLDAVKVSDAAGDVRIRMTVPNEMFDHK